MFSKALLQFLQGNMRQRLNNKWTLWKQLSVCLVSGVWMLRVYYGRMHVFAQMFSVSLFPRPMSFLLVDGRKMTGFWFVVAGGESEILMDFWTTNIPSRWNAADNSAVGSKAVRQQGATRVIFGGHGRGGGLKRQSKMTIWNGVLLRDNDGWRRQTFPQNHDVGSH